MQSYFGVTPAQASRSQFRAFQAYGGIKRAGFGLTAIYKVGDSWLIASDAAAQRLLGAAARSPITESKAEFSVDMNLVYTF